jgi:chitinase
MSTTPPRNVIYYNDGSNPIPLAGISGLPYTDVILAFLVPGDNLNLTGQGGAFDSGGNPDPDDIQALQNAGKNVLISIGGAKEGFPSSDWQHYAQDVDSLVEQIAGYVTANGFSGVDIDYEDDYGFTGGPDGTGIYDGITFLIELTNGLAQELPPGQNIITHAPQPPYFDPNPKARYHNAYTQIWQAAGNNISWFNCQFYNNPAYSSSPNSKVSWYETFAGAIGASELLMGVPLDPAGSGYLPLGQFTSQVIAPLRQAFGSAFGGVMGWEFSYDQDGTWAEGTAQALGGTGTPTPGQEYTIRPGDTLYSIATFAYSAANASQGVTAIATANPGIDPDDLQIGQQIYIPVLA